jgi:FdhD protein
MKEGMEGFPVLKVQGEGRNTARDMVATEFPLTIILNEEELTTLLCTPKDLEYLAAGFLASSGFIEGREEIKGIIIDDERGMVRVETKETKEIDRELLSRRYPQAISHINSGLKVKQGQVFSLMDKFQGLSPLFRITGGVHSAALCSEHEILAHSDDIGRHNALDKVFGRCILEDISTDGRIMITSGRVSQEVLLKVAMRKISIILSISAPTDMAVKLAAAFSITLIGFARGRSMNIYTESWRVVAR